MAFNWTCPYCNRPQSVVSGMYSSETSFIGVKTSEYPLIVISKLAISCANPDCNRLTLHVTVGKNNGKHNYEVDPNNIIFSARLLPQGSAKPQPDFIPKAIVDDYYEACLIKDLSPKAAATLARRCLQGMIRDFCGISKSMLIDEINELRKQVNSGSADRSVSLETVDAIDHIRSIGNIGAHMESDINLIVPVERDEADILIQLLEMLFEDWYISREKRKNTLSRLSNIAQEKAQARLSPPNQD